MKKRLFSIVLSLCMVLALMPQMVFADEETGTAAETVGKYATNPIGTGKKATITIDGSHSDWSEDMLIAQGAAWDVANIYKGSFESSLTDCYSLYAAWDDDNLYIGWQMVNTTDTWARKGDGPLSDGGRIGDYPMMLALSIAPNSTGMTGRLTNGNKIWDTLDITFTTHTDALLLMSAKVGMGTPALFKAADAEGNTSYDAEYCKYFKDNGIQYAMEEGCLPTNLWMIDPESQLKTPQEDIYGGTVNYVDVLTDASGNKQHDTNYDSFYEIKIPFDVLGIDVDYLESNGIGVMQLATKGESAIDCLPHDPSMLDNAMEEYAKDSSTSHEKDDNDNITVPFAIVGGGEKNTVNAPSVSAYATKDQLMGNTFAPNADGTANNIGKLVFGKNSEGSSQEWYILGKDTYVSGDNTIIFAASTIATNQSFEDDKDNNKTEASLWSDCNYNGVSITEVYPNHYGASDLRAALQSMATNETYFTTAEQGMMNATTVTTKDMKNSSVPYTTTDKLYALAADNFQGNTIIAGSKNQIVLASTSYWNSGGKDFWLRSPYTVYSNYTEAWRNTAIKWNIEGACVNNPTVNALWDVRPASNLNLSSVLFASAATAASSDTEKSGAIADGTAMTLRLDGTGKNIGTVTYNSTTGDIKITKGSTESAVALIVQGSDGTKDWYYSKKITGTETEIVNVSDITTELGLSADIDLSTVKIWLETTDAADGMIYAVNPITSDKLISITPPEPITVENGTAYEDMNLPETVEVETEGNSVTRLPVEWDTARPAEGSYDPTIKTEQAVTLYGFLQLPDGLEWNPDSPAYTTITITIKAASGTSDDSDKDNSSDKDNGTKTNSEDSAKTGDDTNLALWLALMILAGAGIAATTVYTRRKRTNE